jgi:hypothetical protein
MSRSNISPQTRVYLPTDRTVQHNNVLMRNPQSMAALRSSGLMTCLAPGLLMCSAAAAAAQPRPAVVELFTSEGCSSCPPAEAYIGELAQRSDVLALSFHVDYWDSLGWRDRFALETSVERQRIYSRSLGRSSVYTPEVVIDGRSDYVGTDRSGIAGALAANRAGVPVAISLSGGEVLVEVAAQDRLTRSDVVLIAYLAKALSPIGRGENAGRTLQEFNVVRAVRTLGRWEGRAGSFRAQLSSLPRDATDVAVLVQPLGQGPIIGVASRRLESITAVQ